MFVINHTYQISDTRIIRALKNKEMGLLDKTSRSGNKTKESRIKKVKSHIKSFPLILVIILEHIIHITCTWIPILI